VQKIDPPGMQIAPRRNAWQASNIVVVEYYRALGKTQKVGRTHDRVAITLHGIPVERVEEHEYRLHDILGAPFCLSASGHHAPARDYGIFSGTDSTILP
jgi:hypothetical protein